MTNPASSIATVVDIADLSAMQWQDFERFSVGVLAQYYRDAGLDIEPTRFQKDGGRDGEAVYTFAPPDDQSRLADDLAIVVRLWVEVKQRRDGKVDIREVGGHVILAENQRVAKLVFVTNASFAGRLVREMRQYCNEHRISCAFINGARLLAIYRRTGVLRAGALPADEEACAARVSVRFASTAFTADDALGSEPLYIEPDAPAFVIADIDIEGTPLTPLTGVEIGHAGGQILRPYWASFQAPMLAGERCRLVYVIRPEPGTTLSAEDITVKISGLGGSKLIRDVQGAVVVSPRYLVQTDIPAQQAAVAELTNRVASWLSGGGMVALGLRGYPGTGKSYLLNALRLRWIGASVSEIVLDGEVHREPLSIWKAVFGAVMQLPPVAEEERDAVIRTRLERSGVGAAPAQRLAAAMEAILADDTALHDPLRLAETLAVALRLTTSERRVLVIEDLHKISPSGLQMILQMLRLLRHQGRGNLLIVATSRPGYEVRDSLPGQTAVLHDTLESVFEELGGDLVTIKLTQVRDAARLLQATVLGLEAPLAEHIVTAVGTSPFALKETIAYLAQTGELVSVDARNGLFRLANVEVFHKRLQPDELKGATRKRLAILLKALSTARPWLPLFLLGGAVLGRNFPVDLALAAAGGAGTTLDNSARTELFRWDILGVQSQDGQSQAVFNHDLIRSAVLDMVLGDEAHQIAAKLFDAGRERLAPLTLARLGLLAGRVGESRTLAAAEADAATRDRRHWDALQAHLLQLHAHDPDVFATLMEDKGLGSLARLDETLFRLAPPDSPAPAYTAARRRYAYDILFRCLDCLTRIGVGKRYGFAALISEAAMLAKEHDDDAGRARLAYFQGRIEFDQDCFAASNRHHSAAEEILRRMADGGRARIENLNRLFLCLRQSGNVEEAACVLETLEQLNNETPDPEQAARITAYRGHAQLYNRPEETLALWRQAAEQALENGRHDRFPEHIIGVGYMELLVGSLDQAKADFQAAERALGMVDAGSSRLRLHLDRGALGLVTGRLAEARLDLEEAVRIGITYAILRRLWRVDANLATLHEALENRGRTYAYDARCIAGLAARVSAEAEFGSAAPWLVQRHALPVLNITLRARAGSAEHARLLDSIPAAQCAVVDAYAARIEAGSIDGLPVGIRIHLKGVRDGMRCIVTE